MKTFFSSTKVQIGIAGLIILLAIILGVTDWKLPGTSTTITSSTNRSTNQSTTVPTYVSTILPAEQITGKQVHITTPKGDIIFSLDAAQSPIAVSNFVKLAGEGYYTGIKWHRVESWVIQGGDPQTKDASISPNLWGTGGPGYTIQDEPVTGEYLTGVVAMAKTAAPNSAGSQIFILKADTPLPKSYQIIGKVTSGLDVVQAIAVGDTMTTVVIEPAS